MTACSEKNKRKPRSLVGKLGLAVASILLTLLVLEGVFRIAGIQGVYLEQRRDTPVPGPGGNTRVVPHGFVPGATIVSRYDTDPRGTFGPSATVEHKFNSAGWRDLEHSTEKPKDTFRILGLGDSYLFGQGIKREDICLSKLEGLLQKNEKVRRIECINTGISGFNTGNQRDLLLNRGLQYDPDLVIVFFVLNDVEPNMHRSDTRVEFFREYTALYQQPDTLSRYSRIWSWGRQRFLQNTQAASYIRDCVESFSEDSDNWKHSQQALNEIQQICTENDIGFLVAIFPFFVNLDGEYPFQSIHDIVRAHCEDAGIDVIDIRKAYAGHSGPDLWVHPTDQHPNEEAHEIAAQAVAEHLGQGSLLPRGAKSAGGEPNGNAE